jgi:hypothetical protein
MMSQFENIKYFKKCIRRQKQRDTFYYFLYINNKKNISIVLFEKLFIYLIIQFP